MARTHPTAYPGEPPARCTTDGADRGGIRREHLEQWLAVTREYLLADHAAPTCPSTRSARRHRRTNEISLRLARLESAVPVTGDDPALQAALPSWAHRHMLRLLRHAQRSDSSPLRVLEGVFRFQVSFAANHPLVPAQLLAGLAADGDAGIRQRIRNAVGHYEAKLAQLIERARARGEAGAGVDPRAAARLLIALLHGLMIRMRSGVRTPEQMHREATELFPIYLDALRAGTQTPATDVHSRERLR